MHKWVFRLVDLCLMYCGCSSVVERLVANEEIVGSIPTTRSGHLWRNMAKALMPQPTPAPSM